MRPAIRGVSTIAFLALVPTLAGAQGVVIDHKRVDCIVAGKHPRMNACFKPATNGGKRRVYFRREGVTSWFYVEMKSNAPCHEGVLPKPKKQLVGKHVYYYIATEGAETGQTEEYDPVVVRTARECKKDVVAPFFPNAPVVVFPSVPAGFVGGAAVISPVVVGAVAVVGAGTAAAVTLTGGDDTPTVGTTPPVPITQPPATTPTTTTTTTVPPGTRVPLDLACNADPRSGVAPLRVAFRAFPTGGTGVYDYLWRFGDGETSTQVSPGHTYNTSGSYLASVQVTSGGDTVRCERSITVTDPAPPPTTPGPFTLTVTLAGTGTGSVASSPPGIACSPDCTEVYAAGTTVTLSATPTAPSTFGGWTGGGCSGTGPCVVAMNANQAVTATFNPPGTFLLTVNLAGGGTGTVSSAPAGIACPGDCTEAYIAGTNVALTATATGGSTFAGWSGGGCSGTGGCSVTMTAAQTVTATFNPPTFLLTVTLSGAGTGGVTSAPAGISCQPDCTEPYTSGTMVTLAAAPIGGSTFGGWSGGGCSGTGSCVVTMNAAQTVNALFNQPGCLARLDVTLSGTGSGFVTSNPPGINCLGNDCNETYACGTTVQLTATPRPLSTFVTWSGGGCSGGGGCTILMNVATTVDARFDATAFNLTVSVTGQFGGGGQVTSTPAGITCTHPTVPGDVCTAPFPPATVVRLTGVPAPQSTPVQWGSDCTGTPQGGQCSLTMDQTRFADATFVLGFTGTRPGEPTAVRWASHLEAPGAAGQTFLNGGLAGDQRTARAELRGQAKAGANHVEALLTGAAGPGVWRFEFPEGQNLEPGSLVPLQGEVVQVTAQSIVFRVKGQAGERVAFTFRRKD